MIEKKQVIDSLRKVLDPEVMINVVDLGLIEDIRIKEKQLEVDFLLTYPGCPLGPEIQRNMEKTLREDLGIDRVYSRIVWNPPWDPSRMSEEARFTMGYPI